MRTRRHRRIAACTGVALCVAIVGCNALLGNESAVFDPGGSGDGGDGGGDGGASPDATANGDARVIPDADPDSGPCVNTDNNPKHCGACLHDCLGGLCIARQCQPIKLATEAGKPAAINVDATHIYWSNATSGSISRVPKTGGSIEPVFTAVGGVMTGKQFAIRDGQVYFARNTVGVEGIYRCPVTGCSAATPPVEVVPALMVPDFVTIEANDILIWAEARLGGKVGRCTLPACGDGELLVDDGEFALRASARGGVVTWSRLLSGGGIRVRINGGAPSTILPNIPARDVLLLGSPPTDVLFTRLDNGLQAAQLDGGNRRSLTGEATQTEYFALLGNEVFFPDSRSAGRIVQCSLGGCGDAGTTLASQQAMPRAVAVDERAVYWTNEGQIGDSEGTINKVAR